MFKLMNIDRSSFHIGELLVIDGRRVTREMLNRPVDVRVGFSLDLNAARSIADQKANELSTKPVYWPGLRRKPEIIPQTLCMAAKKSRAGLFTPSSVEVASQ